MIILNFKEWFLNETINTYISLDEFLRRLSLLGWRLGNSNGSHIQYDAPSTAIPSEGRGTIGGRGKVTISTNNYDKNFSVTHRSVFRQFPDIKSFFYNQRFEVPSNFDISQQKFISTSKVKTLKVSVLYKNIIEMGESPDEFLKNKKINDKTVEMASFDSGKLEIIYSDGTSEEFSFYQDISIEF